MGVRKLITDQIMIKAVLITGFLSREFELENEGNITHVNVCFDSVLREELFRYEVVVVQVAALWNEPLLLIVLFDLYSAPHTHTKYTQRYAHNQHLK